MNNFIIDQGKSFGTWKDNTSKLLYNDAMPVLLNGIDISGTVADYGGGNGLLKKFIPHIITIDIDSAKSPDIIADILNHKGNYDLVIMRYLLHYLPDKKVKDLFNNIWNSNINRILVIQFINEDIKAKNVNSINETKFFRTEKQLLSLINKWIIRQTKKIHYTVEKEFYKNRLNHPNPTSHEEIIISLELIKK